MIVTMESLRFIVFLMCFSSAPKVLRFTSSTTDLNTAVTSGVTWPASMNVARNPSATFPAATSNTCAFSAVIPNSAYSSYWSCGMSITSHSFPENPIWPPALSGQRVTAPSSAGKSVPDSILAIVRRACESHTPHVNGRQNTHPARRIGLHEVLPNRAGWRFRGALPPLALRAQAREDGGAPIPKGQPKLLNHVSRHLCWTQTLPEITPSPKSRGAQSSTISAWAVTGPAHCRRTISWGGCMTSTGCLPPIIGATTTRPPRTYGSTA